MFCRVRVPLQPGRRVAIQCRFDDRLDALASPFFDGDKVALLKKDRRNIGCTAVQFEVSVRDHLTSLLPGRREAGPVDHVVHPALEKGQQRLAGAALLPLRLRNVVAELPLTKPVDPPRLLLFAKVQLILTPSGPAPLGPFPRRFRLARHSAAPRIAALPLEEEFLPFPTALLAFRARLSSHYRLPLLWDTGVTFFTSSTRIPDDLIV